MKTIIAANEARRAKGFSLAQTLIAMVIISIVAIGTSRIRYFASLDSRGSSMSIAAARVAELFCESWRASHGVVTYDPVASLSEDLGVIEYSTIAPLPEEGGFTELGAYMLVLNGGYYYVTLSWKDISPGLRALNVAVAWARRGRSEDDPDVTDSIFYMTTYTTTP